MLRCHFAELTHNFLAPFTPYFLGAPPCPGRSPFESPPQLRPFDPVRPCLSPHPPTLSHPLTPASMQKLRKIVTSGYTHAAKVWYLSLVQGPFSVAPWPNPNVTIRNFLRRRTPSSRSSPPPGPARSCGTGSSRAGWSCTGASFFDPQTSTAGFAGAGTRARECRCEAIEKNAANRDRKDQQQWVGKAPIAGS